MRYSEECPICQSEDYDVDDYGDTFDQFMGEQWWQCTCSKCKSKFNIIKMYKLSNVFIEEGEC